MRRQTFWRGGISTREQSVGILHDPRLRTYQSNGVKSLSAAVLLQLHAQLVDLGLLLRGDMARVAWEFVLGDSWVIIVVVLWVKAEGGNFCHFDVVYSM